MGFPEPRTAVWLGHMATLGKGVHLTGRQEQLPATLKFVASIPYCTVCISVVLGKALPCPHCTHCTLSQVPSLDLGEVAWLLCVTKNPGLLDCSPYPSPARGPCSTALFPAILDTAWHLTELQGSPQLEAALEHLGVDAPLAYPSQCHPIPPGPGFSAEPHPSVATPTFSWTAVRFLGNGMHHSWALIAHQGLSLGSGHGDVSRYAGEEGFQEDMGTNG